MDCLFAGIALIGSGVKSNERRYYSAGGQCGSRGTFLGDGKQVGASQTPDVHLLGDGDEKEDGMSYNSSNSVAHGRRTVINGELVER